MAALLRTLAASGRNVQGTAAPVHSLGRRDATPVEQRSQPGELRSSKCRPDALVTARVEAEPGPLAALLEVAVAATPLTTTSRFA